MWPDDLMAYLGDRVDLRPINDGLKKGNWVRMHRKPIAGHS